MWCICLSCLFLMLELSWLKLAVTVLHWGKMSGRVPPPSSLLNLITVSFFPLLFVCLGDNHRKPCDSLWHHSCLQFHFSYLCKSPETLVREYFAAKNFPVCIWFANHFLVLCVFSETPYSWRGGDKCEKITFWRVIYNYFLLMFHEKHRSLHMLGVKPKVSISVWA